MGGFSVSKKADFPVVAILSGGTSGEREVSIRSAKALCKALEEFYPVDLIDVTVDALPRELDSERHVVLSALHGTFGEDGGMQKLLEDAGFSYSGSDSESSRLCMDKTAAKELVAAAGVRSPAGRLLDNSATADPAALISELGASLILKPNNEGSSIGLHFVGGVEELERKLKELPAGEWMIEQRVYGRELTVGILENRALGVVEIVPRSGRFDYESKYTAGMTEYHWPAKLTDQQTAEIRQMAEIAFRACGCRDFARADFMMSDRGEIFFLEINTLPGLTETSLLPKSALCEKIDFPVLAKKLAEPAVKRFAELHLTR